MKSSALISVFLLWCCGISYGQVSVYSYKQLTKRIDNQSDTTYIVSFWATWCKPCIAEIPVLERVQAENQQKKLKVLLVSLDFVQDKDKSLIPFIAKNQLKASVILLNEPDYNQWIDKIDPKWTGTIPATLIVNRKRQKRVFVEKALNYKELMEKLNNFL